MISGVGGRAGGPRKFDGREILATLSGPLRVRKRERERSVAIWAQAAGSGTGFPVEHRCTVAAMGCRGVGPDLPFCDMPGCGRRAYVVAIRYSDFGSSAVGFGRAREREIRLLREKYMFCDTHP